MLKKINNKGITLIALIITIIILLILAGIIVGALTLNNNVFKQAENEINNIEIKKERISLAYFKELTSNKDIIIEEKDGLSSWPRKRI